MKKILNNPNEVVEDMLKGVEISNQDICYDREFAVISRKKKIKKVGLVSGGGSGHEPAHFGYVGFGMLDAAVNGNVFASPSPDRILKGIELANSGEGVLLIIKNYAGDIMNFEIAEELAKDEGYMVDHVIVKDDVASEDNKSTTGRRGISGSVFVHKIAGAKAESGASIGEVKRVAEKTIMNVRSFGVSLSPCTIPAVGSEIFHMEDDVMEVGMGIHGESGIEKMKVGTSKEISKLLIDKLLEDLDYDDCEVAVMVNGLGGTPLMELYIISADIDTELKLRGLKPMKYYVGNYMTAIEMAGVSCSLLKLDEELKALLLKPCHTMVMKEGLYEL